MGNDFDYLWKMKKGENMTIKMRFSLPTLDDVLLEKWKSLYSTVFLQYSLIMQNSGGAMLIMLLSLLKREKIFGQGQLLVMTCMVH